MNDQSYGDDKVHFDPIRAVQSIKLSNNYRTARSNDNFLSTVVLNTYFFNNAVVHHDEIQQPPPKLPYEADNYHSSESSSTVSLSGDESCSCDCSSSDSNSEYDDIKTEQKHHQISASQNNISNYNIHNIKYDNNNQSMRYKFGHKFRKRKKNNNNNNNMNMNMNNSYNDLQYAQSTPHTNALNKHHKSSTMTNIYIPSKVRHMANPNKASQILGINSDAVIFANHKSKSKQIQNKKKKNIFQHRKSNSFSETLRNIKNMKQEQKNEMENEYKNDNDNFQQQEMDINDHETDETDEMDDDEFSFKQLKFDQFKPQKRNTGSSRHITRSQTLDLTNSNAIKSIVINDENDNNILMNTVLMNDYKIKKNNNNKMQLQLQKHSKHISIVDMDKMDGIKQIKKTKRRRNRNRNRNNNNIESSDVIEIKFKIDFTKKGYLFIGIISANKINTVVQPGFMFGFNEYTYSFHGYSGKLYHNKTQNDYYFAPNNAANNSKQQKHKQKQQRINRSNTVDITQGISGITQGNEHEHQHMIDRQQNENENENKQQQQSNSNNNNNNNKKLPVLQSGDIITLKMKLNRNNGKFGVVYCINNIDYGIAWKTIDPPVTLGVTMVGRKEQITLLSCSYKPYKNDKSCVIL